MRCPQCQESIPRYLRSRPHLRSRPRYQLLPVILTLVGGTIGYVTWMALNLLAMPFGIAFLCGVLAGSGFVLWASYLRRFRRIYCPHCKQDWDIELRRFF